MEKEKGVGGLFLGTLTPHQHQMNSYTSIISYEVAIGCRSSPPSYSNLALELVALFFGFSPIIIIDCISAGAQGAGSMIYILRAQNRSRDQLLSYNTINRL